jgi:methyl-accepting chemotaxis protein
MSDKYEIRERTIATLKFRVTLFFFFFFIAIFAVFIITSVMQVNTVVRFVGSQLAIPTVERATELIDGNSFERVAYTLDPNESYYEKARKELYNLKLNTGCLYLYTMAPRQRGNLSSSIYRYVIDGSAPPDDEKNFSPIGTEEDITLWETVFLEAALTKKIVLGNIDRSDMWGGLISAYGPIINSRGTVVGIIGCDLEAREIVDWVRNSVFWQLGIVLGFTALGLIVYINLLRRINRVYQAE